MFAPTISFPSLERNSICDNKNTKNDASAKNLSVTDGGEEDSQQFVSPRSQPPSKPVRSISPAPGGGGGSDEDDEYITPLKDDIPQRSPPGDMASPGTMQKYGYEEAVPHPINSPNQEAAALAAGGTPPGSSGRGRAAPPSRGVGRKSSLEE